MKDEFTYERSEGQCKLAADGKEGKERLQGKNINSVEFCQAMCDNNKECNAVEYNVGRKMCEQWLNNLYKGNKFKGNNCFVRKDSNGGDYVDPEGDDAILEE